MGSVGSEKTVFFLVGKLWVILLLLRSVSPPRGLFYKHRRWGPLHEAVKGKDLTKSAVYKSVARRRTRSPQLTAQPEKNVYVRGNVEIFAVLYPLVFWGCLLAQHTTCNNTGLQYFTVKMNKTYNKQVVTCNL